MLLKLAWSQHTVIQEINLPGFWNQNAKMI